MIDQRQLAQTALRVTKQMGILHRHRQLVGNCAKQGQIALGIAMGFAVLD